jgi:hypothetical protein
MTTPRELNLTAGEAAARIEAELRQAEGAYQEGDLDASLDCYVRALGLALQLGPAPTELALLAILRTAHTLAQGQDSEGLSALGPALAGLVTQMQEARALPASGVMELWAALAVDLGALISQLGLAMGMPRGHRAGMMDLARNRAALVDDATSGAFGLTAWLDEIPA